ncbi:MAG: arginine deiminase-related protein [Candidatus Omnitrophota bacterium]
MPPSPARAETSQTADTVLIASPESFSRYANSTAYGSSAQNPGYHSGVISLAVEQFLVVTRRLEKEGVTLYRLTDNEDFGARQTVFPGERFSTHRNDNGTSTLVIYPLAAPYEAATNFVDAALETFKRHRYQVDRTFDLSYYESEGRALEGSGSIVFDRARQVAFCALSPNTDKAIADEFCETMGYRSVYFQARDKFDTLVRHTADMMSVGEKFAVVCAESIRDSRIRETVLEEIRLLGKEVIEISLEQMLNACGAIIQLRSADGRKLIILSKRAHEHFTEDQLMALRRSGKLVVVESIAIEEISGSGIGGLMAEVF